MKKYLKTVLVLFALVLLLPVIASAENGVYDVTAEAELRSAVGSLTDGGSVTVRLQNDVTIDSDLKVSAGTLTIKGQGNTLLFRSGSMTLIGSATVNLGTKEGENDPENVLVLTSTAGTLSVVHMGGTSVLNMYNGVSVKDSSAGGQAGGVQLVDHAAFNMYGGVISNCVNWASLAGGVSVDGAAQFTMHDGIIQDCSGYWGGAVTVSAGPVIGGSTGPNGPSGFHMLGGTIKDCHDNLVGGGAICVFTENPVSLIIDGGTITGCSADGEEYGYGGAIFASATHKDAVIRINKVEIKENRAVYGGGIFVGGGSVKIADGVALHNNTAEKAGDDLFIDDAAVTVGKVADGLVLSACGCDIDGWYCDDEGARWSSTGCGGAEDQMECCADSDITNTRGLKAAHGAAVSPSIEVTITEAEDEEPPNPTTGANDMTGVAAAATAVFLLGAAAVMRRK